MCTFKEATSGSVFLKISKMFLPDVIICDGIDSLRIFVAHISAVTELLREDPAEFLGERSSPSS